MNFLRAQLQSFKLLSVAVSGFFLLRFIRWSLRWKTIGLEGPAKHWPYAEPRIIVFWHGHQLLMPWIYIDGLRREACRKMYVLISAHQDGRIMAKVIGLLGVGSISGSSTRGGRQALFDMIKMLKSGSHVALSPDGPKGPRRKLKSGVIRIAQKSGAPIYPAALASQRKWTFGSWDSMTLPKPFSKAILIMGDPISIPEKVDEAALFRYTEIVEAALNKVAQQAEEFRY